MLQPYRFTDNDRVPKECPSCEIWDIVKKGNMSRADKDRIFHTLQGNSGKHNYKMGGWSYPLGQFMHVFLVKYRDYGWQEIFAFDKTCIRKSFYTNAGIIEIIEKPQTKKKITNTAD